MIEQHAKGGLDKWRQQKALGQAGHRVDILQRLIDHGDKYPEEKLSETELICEIMEIMYISLYRTRAEKHQYTYADMCVTQGSWQRHHR